MTGVVMTTSIASVNKGNEKTLKKKSKKRDKRNLIIGIGVGLSKRNELKIKTTTFTTVFNNMPPPTISMITTNL